MNGSPGSTEQALSDLDVWIRRRFAGHSVPASIAVTAATVVTRVRATGPMRIAGTAYREGMASRAMPRPWRWRAGHLPCWRELQLSVTVVILLRSRCTSQPFETLEPTRHSVPTGAVLVHQPSLRIQAKVVHRSSLGFRANVVDPHAPDLSYGWQALCAEAARATRGEQTKCTRESPDPQELPRSRDAQSQFLRSIGPRPPDSRLFLSVEARLLTCTTASAWPSPSALCTSSRVKRFRLGPTPV